MPDHLPVIGPDHRVAGLYHVTGHRGAGIGLSVFSEDGELHWSPLRDSLTRQEASDLIERLDKFEQNLKDAA
jgi:hypothetical protein